MKPQRFGVIDGGSCPPIACTDVWSVEVRCSSDRIWCCFKGVGYGRRVGADVIPGLVVLLDGIPSEPMFDARVIVIQPPECFGY